MTDKEKKPDIIKIESKKNLLPQRAIMKQGLIPSHPTVSIFSGGIGSGKTVLLLNLLTRDIYYGKKNYNGKHVDCYFNKIYLFSPTARSDDLWDEASDIIPEEHRFDNPNVKDLSRIISEQKAEIEKKGIDKSDRILFIFDDCQPLQKFMKSPELKQCIFAGRHLNSSSWVVGQSFTQTPRAIRLQASHVFYFQGNESENKIISDEYGIMGLNTAEMNAIIQHCTQEKYSFLHINKKCPNRAERFRKNITGILRVKQKSDRISQ